MVGGAAGSHHGHKVWFQAAVTAGLLPEGQDRCKPRDTWALHLDLHTRGLAYLESAQEQACSLEQALHTGVLHACLKFSLSMEYRFGFLFPGRTCQAPNRFSHEAENSAAKILGTSTGYYFVQDFS